MHATQKSDQLVWGCNHVSQVAGDFANQVATLGLSYFYFVKLEDC